MRDASPTVVAGDAKALEAQRGHHGDLIGGHRALRVGQMLIVALGFAAIAIAAQIGRDYGVMLGERGSDLVPHHMRLRISMEQQQGRSGALHYYIDSHSIDGETPGFELLEHHYLVSG